MKLISFSGAWCVPCKQQKPIVMQFVGSHPDVKLEQCNVEDPDVQIRANAWMITSVPTLVMTDDSDNVLAAQAGLHDAKRLESLYQQARARL